MASRSLNSSYISIQNNEPEIEINEDNLDMFKYSIKIINNPKIQIIDSNKNKNNEENKEIIDSKINKDQIEASDNKEKNENEKEKDKNKQNKENKLENQEEIYDYGELNLTEEDVYNIVSILYSYNFIMLNKAEYDLSIEKEKIKVSNLTQKLLTFDGENNKNEKITDEEIKNLCKLLKDRETLMKFFVMLNNYRTTGRFETTKRSFDILVKIFTIAHDFLLNNRDIILEGLILILSQTYYKMENGEKIYIQRDIKAHPLFKREEFWRNYLNETIDEEIERMKKADNLEENIFKEKNKRKISEHILSKIVPFTSYMYDFGLKEDIIMDIVNNILDKYVIDEERKAMILSILENYS